VDTAATGPVARTLPWCPVLSVVVGVGESRLWVVCRDRGPVPRDGGGSARRAGWVDTAIAGRAVLGVSVARLSMRSFASAGSDLEISPQALGKPRGGTSGLCLERLDGRRDRDCWSRGAASSWSGNRRRPARRRSPTGLRSRSCSHPWTRSPPPWTLTLPGADPGEGSLVTLWSRGQTVA